MGILSWIVVGLIAGMLAKFLLPGRDPGGLIMTTVIGIVGGLLGGWIGTTQGWGGVSGIDLRSIGLAILGSLVLLILFRIVRGRS
jgi:uncharacterized membrane protein YeaQ/YmgE (transglycosylase-associated protein family)